MSEAVEGEKSGGKAILIVAVYVTLVVLELLWHWMLSGRNEFAVWMMRAYLFRGRWSASGYFDLVMPCAVAGFLTGRVGHLWSRPKVLFFVLLAGGLFVAITPLYVILASPNELWWWPTARSDGLRALVFQLVKAWALLGFFTYAGRVFAAHARSQQSTLSK